MTADRKTITDSQVVDACKALGLPDRGVKTVHINSRSAPGLVTWMMDARATRDQMAEALRLLGLPTDNVVSLTIDYSQRPPIVEWSAFQMQCGLFMSDEFRTHLVVETHKTQITS